jgi:hypothetical protein
MYTYVCCRCIHLCGTSHGFDQRSYMSDKRVYQGLAGKNASSLPESSDDRTETCALRNDAVAFRYGIGIFDLTFV